MRTVTLSSRRILTAVAVLIVFGISTGTASASTYFLKIDGIAGESNDRTHRDWIDVGSFYWGITRNATVGSGSGGAAIGSPLSWTQLLDSSVPKLFSGVATGKHFRDATLEVQSEGSTPNVFFRMEFDNLVLTALKLSGTDDVSVAGAFVYSSLTMTYWDYEDGRLRSTTTGTWDFSDGASATFSGSPEVLEGLMLAGPSAVPAPAAVWLLGTGLLGLMGSKWRSRRGALSSQRLQ